MLLATTKAGSTIQGGIQKVIAFSFEIDDKLFALVCDKIYQNKIGSLCREISCNAYDAHVAAGKADVPFIIHTPTRIEPYFAVIDQGVGMSAETIENVFVRFGKSTKTNTNDQIGAMGFGSKTPFAYKGAFTIVSVQDGIRNSYAAVINDEGKPEMNLLGTEETEEANGTTIEVPVETYDFQEFYDELATQLRYFKVKPIIKGMPIEFPNPMAHVFETVDDNTHFRRSGDVEVVQGGVAYPVDLAQLVKNVRDRPNLVKFINTAVSSYSPVMFFDIGQIAVTMSREAISYDTATVKNILDRLENVYNMLLAQIQQRMQDAPNIWEKTRTLRQNRDLYSKFIEFKDNPWGVHTVGNDAAIEVDEKVFHTIDTGKGKVRHDLSFYTGGKTRTGNFRLDITSGRRTIVPEDNAVIVIDDGCGYHASRLRRYIADQNNRVYFLSAEFAEVERTWQYDPGDGSPVVQRSSYHAFVQGDVDPATLSTFLDAVDGATVVWLSDLPKEERVLTIRNSDGTVTERPKYVPAKAYKWDGFNRDRDFDTFKNYAKTFIAPKKMTEQAAYVLVDNRTVTIPDFDYNDTVFLRIAMVNELFPVPIYAIREKDVGKIADNPLWSPLKTVVDKCRNELLQKYKMQYLREGLRYSGESFEQFVSSAITESLIENRSRLDDHLFRGLLGRMERYNKRRRKRRSDDMCEHLYHEDMQKIRDKAGDRDKRRKEVIKSRYTIFAALSNYRVFNSNDLDDLIDLLNIRYKKALLTKVKQTSII